MQTYTSSPPRNTSTNAVPAPGTPTSMQPVQPMPPAMPGHHVMPGCKTPEGFTGGVLPGMV